MATFSEEEKEDLNKRLEVANAEKEELKEDLNKRLEVANAEKEELKSERLRGLCLTPLSLLLA